MGRVDVKADEVRRFVVYHYRHDPERHQRRHVLVAAFDDEREFVACLRSVQAHIDRRRARSEPVDRQEHATGQSYEPGHLRRAAIGHLVRRMIEHGVDPGPWVDERELPSTMSLIRASVAAGRATMVDPAPPGRGPLTAADRRR